MLNKLLITLFLFSSFSACGQKQPQSIDSYFQRLHENKQFNGSVLVKKGDSFIYENSLGHADGAKSEKLNAEHLFGLGSIYKEFSGVAIMQLQEQGKLSLDDPLSRHLEGFPNWADQVQLKHLLQYSSGLPRVNWGDYFQQAGGPQQAQLVEDLKQLETLSFAPGGGYIYSNYNPLLLIAIVEEIAGLAFKSYVEEHILKPHQIKGIEIELKYPFQGTAPFAIPFNAKYEEDAMEYGLMTIGATPEGIYQWMDKLSKFEIISAKSVKTLSQKFVNDPSHQSALGSCDWEADQLTYHAHHGSTGNYECLIRNYKSQALVIILLTNQKNQNLHEIADTVDKMMQ